MPNRNTETLAQNEALLQGAIDSLTGNIAVLDRHGVIVQINRSWENLVLHNLEDGRNFGLGSNYIESCGNFGGTIGASLAEGVKEVLDGSKEVFELDFPFETPAETRWYAMRVSRFGAGEDLRVLVRLENITPRKLTEEALRESEESYRILAQTASDVIIKIDSTSRILFINRAAERIFGYKTSEMIGQSLTMLIPEAMREKHEKGIERYLRTGRRKISWESMEIPAQRRDGTIFPLEISFGESEQRGRHFFIGIARDISARKEAEKVTTHLAEIVKSSDDAIISKDLDGIITSWNRGAEKIFGYTAEEAVGQPITILIPPHLHEEEKKILDRIHHGKEIRHYNTVRRRKDGTDFNISLTVSPLVDQTGRVIGASKIARDITERMRIEQNLRENQMMLALAMQSSRMGAWELDIGADVVLWSEELEEIFGLEKGSFEQTYEAYYELVHKEDRERIRREVQDAISERREYSIEFRFYHADGSIRWMEGRGQAVYSEKGEPVRVYGIGIDITERKMAEAAVRESEERFRQLADSAPVLIWLNDTEGCYYVNRQYLNFLGVDSLENVRGIDWAGFIHPDDRDEYVRAYLLAFEKRDQFVAQFRFRRADGEYRWMTSTGLPRFSGSGEFFGFVGSTVDIHDLKTAQEAVIRAERKAADDYQTLLSRIVPVAETLGTARHLLTIYRTVGEFIRASMPCTAFFVSFYEEARNLRIAAYVCGENGEIDISTLPPMTLTPDGGPNSQAIFQKKSVIANRYMAEMRRRPHVIIDEDGNDPNSSLVVPMKVMNRIIGTFEVQAYEANAFRDEHVVALEMVANLAAVAIENVRLLEGEARARQEAEAANRAKDEFLSVLSHELRTPLNAMLGWSRMMRSGVLDEDRMRQAIETIERNARLQNNLIEDLLDVSRIISGKMRIESGEVDFVSIVKTCVETAKPAAEDKKISLSLKSDSPALRLNGDATRLQQIINNLLHNAVKFTPENGHVSVSLERRDDRARLKISDTGIGISPDFLPRIFDRFRQADSTTRRSHSGLGLGLTIVRHLIELHGGKIEVSSRGENQGSVFTVELPIETLSAERIAPGKADETGRHSFRLKGARILLVDDDCEGVQPLQMFLETHEADVHCAGSGREALEKISEQRFDVLVSDIGMPEMDGYELIGEARRLTNGRYFLPAVALTAYASSQDRERALQAGYQTHLSKPVDFEQMLAAINDLLGLRN